MVISPFSFAKIPPLFFGLNTISKLPFLLNSISVQNILIVTGKNSLDLSGNWSQIEAILRENKINFQRISYYGEPTSFDVDRLCQEYRRQNIQAVVGIGGGSIIDLGKAISAMLPHNNSIFDHLEGVGKGIPHNGVKVPYIAIPTTSGTGAEVTKNAVIGGKGYKKSLRHDNLIPDAVIIDGNFLVSCPREITIACGMDAFTQLLEPFFSPTASPLTDAIALSGIEKIAKNFRLACGEGANNPEIRLGMAYASLCSGISLANAGLGIVHGFASPLGGLFPIPHGVACGTLMAISNKVTLEAMKKRDRNNLAIEKMAIVGEILAKEKGKSKDYYTDYFINILEQWTEDLAIPKLGKYGIKSGDLAKIIEETSNRNNPIKLNQEEMFLILETRLTIDN